MDDNTLNNNTSNNTTIHIVYNPEYYDEELRHIIKKARQNERYKLPIHANYYKWKKDVNIRPYLPLFAGIGIEKLYLFYTHVLYILDIHSLSNGTYRGERYKQIWKDMLMMVQEPLFVRKLRKLENFTEDDFIKICNTDGGAMVSIIEEGQEYFGFDRKQLLYFLVDIAVNSIQHYSAEVTNHKRACIIRNNSYHLSKVLLHNIYRGKKLPKEDKLHALKTLYTCKVKIQNTNTNVDKNTNVGNESFLYELNFEKLREHYLLHYDDKLFKEIILDTLKPLITVDEETQTEEAN